MPEALPISIKPEHIHPYSLPQECLSFQPDEMAIRTTFKNGDIERKIYLNIQLTPEESDNLNKLKLLVEQEKMVLLPSIAVMACRYISRARGDVNKALQLMKTTQEWRLEFFKEGPVVDTELLEDFKLGIVYWGGRDQNMRPLLIIRANRIPQQWHKDKANAVLRFVKILVFCMEYFLRFMCVPGRIENNIVIADLKGLGATQVPIGLLSKVYSIMNNFSGRVYKFYACNLGWGLSAMTSAVTAILSDRQRQKLSQVRDLKELLTDIAPCQLESDLGGTRSEIKEFFPFPLLPGPMTAASTTLREDGVKNCHVVLQRDSTGAKAKLWDGSRSKDANTSLEYSQEAADVFKQCGLPVPVQPELQPITSVPEPQATQAQSDQVITKDTNADTQPPARGESAVSFKTQGSVQSEPEPQAVANSAEPHFPPPGNDSAFPAPRVDAGAGPPLTEEPIGNTAPQQPVVAQELEVDEVKPSQSFWACGVCCR